jgi:monovalent cation/proton antiporter MnhG/PhaG subunit
VTARQLVAGVLLFAGVGVEIVCVLGLVVMRDALDRLHCASAAGFGVLLIAVAVVVQESFSLIGNKALAIALILLVANPVLAHATARTIRIRRHGDWRARPEERRGR